MSKLQTYSFIFALETWLVNNVPRAQGHMTRVERKQSSNPITSCRNDIKQEEIWKQDEGTENYFHIMTMQPEMFNILKLARL